MIKEYFETFDKNGEIYSLSTYSAAFEFAIKREKSFVRTGVWNGVSEVEFEIDKIAPTLVITGVENGGQTSGSVTLSELSEESTVTVKLNDETIEYEIGETLTKTGKYTVMVTDECGNESVYEFEIVKAKKPANVGLIIAFIGSMMVAVGTATFLIIKKKREGSQERRIKIAENSKRESRQNGSLVKFYLNCLTRA